MAFHGHTKIELHNVKTGEDKVIEKHNIFTNYLHDIMQILPTPRPINWMSCGKGSKRYGSIQWNKKNNDCSTIADILCGGILCLENEHTESADNYFLTKDDVVTARGACIANGSADTQLGSYNETLEQSSDTSKTMVWDFSQSQGNGTISTIGLTSIGMGICGLGNFSTNETHSDYNPFGDVMIAKDNLFSISGTYDDNYPDSDSCHPAMLYYSMEKGVLVAQAKYDTSEKILHLRYFHLNSDVINPMEAGSCKTSDYSYPKSVFGCGYSSNVASRYSKVERAKFDLSAYSFTGTSYYNVSITDDGYLYFCPHNTYKWSPGNTLTFTKIDLMNRKIVGTCTMTNTTGVTLGISNNSSFGDEGSASETDAMYWCQNLNGYMLFRSQSSPYRTFAINMENSSDVKEILLEDGNAFSIGRYEMNFSGHRLFQSSDNPDDYKSPLYMIDVYNGVAKCVRTGAAPGEYTPIINSSSGSKYFRRLPSDAKMINVWWTDGGSASRPRSKNNFFSIFGSYKQDTLSTINVLDKPVIKTADMTMRITYTISLEEDVE